MLLLFYIVMITQIFNFTNKQKMANYALAACLELTVCLVKQRNS